jgi:hypothetical protein
MATSGTYSFNLNKTEVITLAYQLINVYNADTTPTSADFNFASKILNCMLKAWQVEGIRLWKRQQAWLIPQLNQYEYQIGQNAAAVCVSEYFSTTLTSSAASGDSSIIVSDTTNIAISDVAAIELDDGTRQFCTISGTTSTSISFAPVLTDTAASGNTVVTYTTTDQINRPLTIIKMNSVDLKNNKQESTVQNISFDQYFALSVKSLPGFSNNYYYDKLIRGAVPHYGKLFLFPAPNPVSTIYTMIYADSIQDITSATDDLDLPQEWLYPVAINLSCELAPFNGKMIELQTLQPKADLLKQSLNEFDTDDEDTTFVISPSLFYPGRSM